MKHLRPAIVLVVLFVLITGVVFPLAVTAVAQVAFPNQANGSLVRENGTVVGSELLGQTFTAPKYFHSRPSAAGSGYDAANSSGTNLGPISDKWLNGIPDDPQTPADESYAGVKQLAAAYRQENGLGSDVVLPSDAVTRSASGLDPHISVKNAELQTPRVARARGLTTDEVRKLIAESTDTPFLSLFGDPAVNVLKLNLSLDRVAK